MPEPICEGCPANFPGCCMVSEARATAAAAAEAFRSTLRSTVQVEHAAGAHRKTLASIASIEADWLQGLITPQQAMEQINEVLQKFTAG